MTIERGRTWGEPADPDLDRDLPELGSDAELAGLWAETGSARADHAVEADHDVEADHSDAPAAVLLAGDLLKTIGLAHPRRPGDRYRYPVDIGLADLDGGDGPQRSVPFVAHLTVRNRPLSGIGPGLSVVVMNAAWLGELKLGPRAHPNDGLLDVTEGAVGLLQRREGTRRARSGSHLPHPALSTTRAPRWDRTFRRPVPIWVDGVRRGRFSAVAVEVVPDALVVVA